MRLDLIFKTAPGARGKAFTLVEVVLALGVLAITAAAMVALQGTVLRSAGTVSAQDRAAQLIDATLIELGRLKTEAAKTGDQSQLDALAALIPAPDSNQPLKLVGEREGLRVVRESDADRSVAGVALRDRYYLIEVRQQASPLSYERNAGFLAVTLTVKWPYQIPTGAGPADVVLGDLAHASAATFNAALSP